MDSNSPMPVAPDLETFQLLRDAVADNDPVKVLRLVTERNVDVNYQNTSGNTLLHQAVLMNAPQVIDALFQLKANLEIRNNEGVTPEKLVTLVGSSEVKQHMDVQRARIDEIKAIIQDKSEPEKLEKRLSRKIELYNIDINHRDADGNSFLHYAIENKSHVAVGTLIRAGIDVEARNYEGITPEQLAHANKENDFESFEIKRQVDGAIKARADEVTNNIRVTTQDNVRHNASLGEGTVPELKVKFARDEKGKILSEKRKTSSGKLVNKHIIASSNIEAVNQAYQRNNPLPADSPSKEVKVSFKRESFFSKIVKRFKDAVSSIFPARISTSQPTKEVTLTPNKVVLASPSKRSTGLRSCLKKTSSTTQSNVPVPSLQAVQHSPHAL